MNAMIVKAKQTAMMRPTNTMRPACCCSGGTFARRFSKALVLDVSFAKSAATTSPRYDCNHEEQSRIFSRWMADKGLHL